MSAFTMEAAVKLYNENRRGGTDHTITAIMLEFNLTVHRAEHIFNQIEDGADLHIDKQPMITKKKVTDIIDEEIQQVASGGPNSMYWDYEDVISLLKELKEKVEQEE